MTTYDQVQRWLQALHIVPMPKEDHLLYIPSSSAVDWQDLHASIVSSSSPAVSLQELLRNGIALCRLANLAEPGCITFLNIERSFAAIDNINQFLEVCRRVFHFKDEELFDIDDLYLLKNFTKVYTLILKLADVLESRNIQPFLRSIPRSISDEQNSKFVARALYSYTAKKADELSFTANETIVVHQKLDGGWWEGETDSHRGWFPSNYAITVDDERSIIDIQKAPMSSSSLLSQSLSELIATETQYVRDLEHVVRVYMTGLLHEISWLPPIDFTMIFGNWADLYRFYQKFLVDLEAIITNDEKCLLPLCSLFLGSASKFVHLYGIYCSNFPRSSTVLSKYKYHPKMSAFLEKRGVIARPAVIALLTQLIKPVQRICRYPLLVHEIVRAGESLKISTETQQSLVHLENTMSLVAQEINQLKHIEENKQLLVEISYRIQGLSSVQLKSFGLLLLDAPFRVMLTQGQRRSMTDRFAFLMENMIILVKKRLDRGTLKYRVKHLIPLNPDKTWVRPVTGPLADHFPSAFHILSDNCLKMTLLARTDEERNKWVDTIEKQLEKNKNSKIPLVLFPETESRRRRSVFKSLTRWYKKDGRRMETPPEFQAPLLSSLIRPFDDSHNHCNHHGNHEPNAQSNTELSSLTDAAIHSAACWAYQHQSKMTVSTEEKVTLPSEDRLEKEEKLMSVSESKEEPILIPSRSSKSISSLSDSDITADEDSARNSISESRQNSAGNVWEPWLSGNSESKMKSKTSKADTAHWHHRLRQPESMATTASANSALVNRSSTDQQIDLLMIAEMDAVNTEWGQRRQSIRMYNNDRNDEAIDAIPSTYDNLKIKYMEALKRITVLEEELRKRG